MKTITVDEIEDYLQKNDYEYTIKCLEEVPISGYSSLSNYKLGTITWVKNQEKADAVSDFLHVALLIAEKGVETNAPNVIYSENSKAVFFGIIDELLDPLSLKPGIGPNTFLSDEVTLGEDVIIGPNCVLDGEITVGDRTQIMAGTVIVNRCTIGSDTVIQPLCTIGIDGFGYYQNEDGRKCMVRHHGGVVIGRHVFIGSHTNIARGTLDDTTIGDYVKIAPSTHIGHNNHIGNNATVICSKLYGSCTIEDDAYLTSCTVKNQSVVGKNALVGMGAVVTKDVPENTVVVGIPAKRLRLREENEI